MHWPLSTQSSGSLPQLDAGNSRHLHRKRKNEDNTCIPAIEFQWEIQDAAGSHSPKANKGFVNYISRTLKRTRIDTPYWDSDSDSLCSVETVKAGSSTRSIPSELDEIYPNDEDFERPRKRRGIVKSLRGRCFNWKSSR